ncbi:MAG: hypothetical protein LAT67_13885, partial [Balneolales bacterium]|nr:hypothetical protein [Balneolales bacterium]
EGFEKPSILFVFDAGAKMKPEYRLSIRGFYFGSKEEVGQKSGFVMPFYRSNSILACINSQKIIE